MPKTPRSLGERKPLVPLIVAPGVHSLDRNGKGMNTSQPSAAESMASSLRLSVQISDEAFAKMPLSGWESDAADGG